MLIHFLEMGGYGFYVWSAYSVVCAVLVMQGLWVWRRFKMMKHPRS